MENVMRLPLKHEKVVLQDRWSSITGSTVVQCNLLWKTTPNEQVILQWILLWETTTEAQEKWSFKTGGLHNRFHCSTMYTTPKE